MHRLVGRRVGHLVGRLVGHRVGFAPNLPLPIFDRQLPENMIHIV